MDSPTEHSTPAVATTDPAVMACIHYRGSTPHPIGLDAISDALVTGDGFVWVGLYEPDAALLAKMQEEFGLHPLAIEDAQKAHQRPKIEAYGEVLFVVAYTAELGQHRLQLGETHLFAGPRFLLSIRHGASRSYAAVRARGEREPAMLVLGSGYALYAVLDAIVDQYPPVVAGFHAELEQLEQRVFSKRFRRSTIVELYELKRELTRMRFAVAPLQDVISTLLHVHGARIPEPVKPYLRDVSDHLLRVNDGIDTMREMLGAAMSVNLSLVTLNQGEVVKRLAGWAALLSVPTLVASWYGMNFEHMPELHQPHAYALLAAVVLLAMSGLFVYLKRIRWL